MNKKVEELVEWVAKEIGQHTENCPWEDCSGSEQDAARRSARFILSHPDLALIVDCECGGNGYEEGGDGAPSWHVVCSKCADTGKK